MSIPGKIHQRSAAVTFAMVPDEARRIANGIAKLPKLLTRRQQPPVGAYGRVGGGLPGPPLDSVSSTSHVGLEDRQLALATSWRGWRIAVVRAAMLRFAQGVDTLTRVFGTLWYYR